MVEKKARRQRGNPARATTSPAERKQAEEAQGESEARFRRLAEHAPDIIFRHRFLPTPAYEYVSPAVSTITGYSPEEFYADPNLAIKIVHPDDREKLKTMIDNPSTSCGTLRWIRRDGAVIWTEHRNVPIYDDEGRMVAVDGIVRDTTEHMRAEEALRESEEKWRSLVENIPDIIMTLDRKGVILFINRTLPGFTPEQIIGTTVYDYVPRKHHDTLRGALERVFATGDAEHYEIAGAGPFGRSSWYASRIGPVMRDGKVVGATLITTDITERRQAEEELKVSKERYQGLVEEISDVIFEVDGTGRITYVSPVVEEVAGYGPSEVIGRTFAEFIHPDDLARAQEVFERILFGYSEPMEFRFMSKSGEVRWNRSVGRPILREGRVAGVRGVLTDITERKRADEALRQSEERYRRLVELSPYAIAVHSEEKIVFVNRRGAEFLGAAHPDEIVGRPLWDFIHPEFIDAVRSRIQRTQPEGQEVDVAEEKVVRLDGQVIDVEMAAIPITYLGKPARQVVLRDVTERKRMEATLQEAREDLESRVERQMQRGNAYGLTFRELTVLYLVGAGRSDKEIGTTLGISPLTASKHIANILRKMRATSRTEAGVRALKEGLLD